MKNKLKNKFKKILKTKAIRKIAGIIALAAIIVFSITVAICRSGGGVSSTFTLTGIPSKYNGAAAYFGDFDVNISGWGPNVGGQPSVSNGRVSWNLWSTGANRYTGDDTFDVRINLVRGPSTSVILDFKSVKFSKGSASRSYNAGVVIWEK